MTTAHVTLSESETRALQSLSQNKGVTQEELLHEAIEQFLTRQQQCNAEDRLALLRQARGLWQGRGDLPDHAEIRDEWNRI